MDDVRRQPIDDRIHVALLPRLPGAEHAVGRGSGHSATVSGVTGPICGYWARMSLHVDPAELAGRLARDAHGRPLGEVETVFSDAAGTSSRFIGIDTEEGRVVVPVDGAEVDPSVYALDLPYMVDRISGAPTISPEVEELDPETERRVVEHFGISEPETKPALVPDPEPEALPESTELIEPVDVAAEPE